MAFRGKSIDKDYILIHDYSCCKCEENDLSAEAQHFCPQCEHYLCDKCVRMHRDYFKKHIVYGRGEIQKWVRFSIDRCEQHGKELEVHCDDHQELCCCLCVALNHRLCSSISHLPDLARGFLKTAKFRQIPEAMDEISRRLDELKNTRVKDQASVNDTYNNFMAQIKALRKEINKILDKLENDTVKHFESIIKDLKKDVKDDLENCDRMNDQLETMFDMLQQITDKHKETSTYISFKKCQTKLSEAYSLVQEIQKRPNVRIGFKLDKTVLPFLRKLKNLGNVRSMPKETYSMHVYKAQSSAKYNVKIKEDLNECHIVGICELPSEDFVIADCYNFRVKLLNVSYQVIDHCNLPACPRDLCHIAEQEIAVVVNADCKLHEVHFFTVSRGKLQAVRQFKTGHECFSIAHHQGQLYVGSDNALFLYAMNGQLKKSVYELISGVHTCAVSPDRERIYITNTSASKLMILDKHSQVLSALEHTNLVEPTGLCVSNSGHVFVCGSMFNSVLQVDMEGRQKLTTVVSGEASGLYYPQSVWFSEQTGSLIVGNNEENSILVVKLC